MLAFPLNNSMSTVPVTFCQGNAKPCQRTTPHAAANPHCTHLLRLLHRMQHELHLRAEPEAIVAVVGEPRSQGVTQAVHLSVQAQALQPNVRRAQYFASWALIHTATTTATATATATQL